MIFTRKSRPESRQDFLMCATKSGQDFLICAISARQQPALSRLSCCKTHRLSLSCDLWFLNCGGGRASPPSLYHSLFLSLSALSLAVDHLMKRLFVGSELSSVAFLKSFDRQPRSPKKTLCGSASCASARYRGTSPIRKCTPFWDHHRHSPAVGS